MCRPQKLVKTLSPQTPGRFIFGLKLVVMRLADEYSPATLFSFLVGHTIFFFGTGPPPGKESRTGLPRGRRALQGYLAHKSTPCPRTIQYGYAEGPMLVKGGGRRVLVREVPQ